MILCVNPECRSPCPKHNARGLCQKCYSQAMRMISGSRTTWAELESLGLATPLQRKKFAAVVDAKRKELKRQPHGAKP